MNWSNRLTHQIILVSNPSPSHQTKNPPSPPAPMLTKANLSRHLQLLGKKSHQVPLPISPKDLIKMTSNIAWTNSCNPCTLAHQSESWPLRLHIKNRFLASEQSSETWEYPKKVLTVVLCQECSRLGQRARQTLIFPGIFLQQFRVIRIPPFR